MKDRDFARLASLASDIGSLLQRKNIQNYHSFEKTPEILKLLYPKGVQPDQYENLLFLVRILDKVNRVAAAGQKGQHIQDVEDTTLVDIAGYAILAQTLREGKKLDEKEKQAKACTEAATKIYSETDKVLLQKEKGYDETNKVLLEAAKAARTQGPTRNSDNPRAVQVEDELDTAVFKFRRS